MILVSPFEGDLQPAQSALVLAVSEEGENGFAALLRGVLEVERPLDCHLDKGLDVVGLVEDHVLEIQEGDAVVRVTTLALVYQVQGGFEVFVLVELVARVEKLPRWRCLSACVGCGRGSRRQDQQSDHCEGGREDVRKGGFLAPHDSGVRLV